jgi:L-asparaginase
MTKRFMVKKILLIATGGTIASSESAGGLIPSFDVEELLAYVPEAERLCHIDGILIMNIDSSNMNPDLVILMAKTVEDNYSAYDGFVITHGTDTMGYTAALLSYMLHTIKKPVVITGSQISIGASDTDAKRNILDAVRFAIQEIPGVFVAFHGKIIAGTRAKKFRTRGFDAFESINFPYVAQIEDNKVECNADAVALLSPGKEPFTVESSLCTDIFILKIFPGLKPDIFDYLKKRYKGIIIESFGIGGMPNEGHNLIPVIRECTEQGLAVVITTQCIEEGIDLDIYQVGRELAKNKIILSYDMNLEAIVAKLMWTLGKYHNIDDVKYHFELPMMGDISRM